MSALKGRKIILGISGSIAVYKSVFLLRTLIKEGAEVQVLMTEAATEFVQPLTFSTLSNRPVFVSTFSEKGWNSHVDLGLWADALVIAPATANTLAKMAVGLADNILLATFLSVRCPVFIAPAMDLDMWKHVSTKRNIGQLTGDGIHLIPVEHGELASGLTGEGRMAEPQQICNVLSQFFEKKNDFQGSKVLITAGPTYEALDPVRYIGNYSSGKMGAALAEVFASRGAEVQLILGPSSLNPRNVKITRVVSAEEMYEASMEHFPNADIAILSAAVADYKPATQSKEKIKKKEGSMQINLVRTRDIAQSLGGIKEKHQILVGFALETHNEEQNARAKIKKKNFDLIVLNSLRDKGAGFQHDTNKISILNRENNKIEKFELKSKKAVACDIADSVLAYARAKKNNWLNTN